MQKVAIKIQKSIFCSLLMWVPFFCFSSMPTARAFKLVPMTMEFQPSGRGSSQAFRVENDADEQVAVQISILTRTMALDGKEENAPEEDDFIVFPTQILLKPRQTQTVRVKWVGNPKPDSEIAYRILVEQLPINLVKETAPRAKLNFVVRYFGSIYIVPKGAKSNVAIESIDSQVDQGGDRKLMIVFRNSGTSRAILRNLTLKLKSAGKTVVLNPAELEGINGENILAGTKRRFALPWPKELPEGKVEATFDFHSRR